MSNLQDLLKSDSEDELTRYYDGNRKRQECEENEEDDIATFLAIDIITEEFSSWQEKRRGGSVVGRRVIPRDPLEGHTRLMMDYFGENARYPAHVFRRRFRTRRELFMRTLKAVEEKNDYLRQR